MFDLRGKVAIVTGGSRGIGRACAKALAQSGAHVVITYVGGEQAATQTLAEIHAAGGQAEAERFDVADLSAAEAAIASVAKRLGQLDILVANAGVSLDGLLLRMREEDLDRTLAVNLKGSIGCARAAVKAMLKSRAGRIIFISSVVGEMGNPGQIAYAASKAGLLGAAKSMAREYASRRITVNAVTPGFIDTDMTHALNEQQQAAMLSGVPLGRPGTVDEVAAAVVYLASDEAGYVTGHALRVNGGMLM
jgi:3-oxoacyl-[acyl-carrier protein] reductase